MHSEAFQFPIVTKQFIQYSFLPRTIASQRSYSTKFGDFQIEDLQLATLIDIAFFMLSTFPLLKLQSYTNAIIFFLSSKYFITFSYSTLARMHTHTESISLEERVDLYPEEEEIELTLYIHRVKRAFLVRQESCSYSGM